MKNRYDTLKGTKKYVPKLFSAWWCGVLTFFLLILPSLNLFALPTKDTISYSTLFLDSTRIMLPLKQDRPKIGVVLSGGGAKGIAHVGTLRLMEKLGIPVDYIAGTSMGAIIGGLYAYGYTADELDTILRKADWNMLLSDKPLRKDVYLTEKLTEDQYLFSLPFGQKKSLIPIGFLRGQHITNLFYSLTSNSCTTHHFSEFNIPFFCIATDVITSNQVILNQGNLAQSMRASMAIPGVFSPVEIDSMLLVDGGLVNNFPVEELKALGADIIIGVDVGFRYKGKENLKNMANLLETTMFMHSKDKIFANRKLCQVLITPNLTGYGTYSFGAVDSLLSRGYSAAYEHYDELKAIADALSEYEKDLPLEKIPYHPKDMVYLSGLEYSGFRKFSPQYANQLLQIEGKGWVKQTDITRGIERLYGSLVFEEVTYEFLPDTTKNDHYILKIKVVESPTNALSLGLRFDNQRSAALLAGVIFRDLGIPNARLTIDGELSKLPSLNVDFLMMPQWKKSDKQYSFWKPSVGASYNFFLVNNEYLYHNVEERNQPSSEFSLQSHKLSIYAQSNWKQNILGVGVRIDYSHISEKFSTGTTKLQNNFFYAVPFLYFLHNSFDAKFFPKQGVNVDVSVSFPLGMGVESPMASRFLLAHAYLDFAVSPCPWLSLYPGFAAAATFFRSASQIPIPYMFYQGGLAPIINGPQQVMFAGLKPFQGEGEYIWNVHLNLQAKVFKNLYFSIRGYAGMSTNEIREMLKLDELIYGGAIGISYNTPIGPVGISFQSSNIHPFNIWLNLLYWL